MKVGTKAVLFGIHQPVLHGLAVLVAWILVYRKLPSFTEAVAIFVHDIGYLGKRNLDGDEGRYHPVLGASIARKFGGAEASELVLGHSRTYACEVGIPVSRLCLPDKLAVFTTPAWAYTFLGGLSAELDEFQEFLAIPRSDRYLVVHAFRVQAYGWALENCDGPKVRARITSVFGPLADTSRDKLMRSGVPGILALRS